MDSVWVLRLFVPYEGSSLLGIYKTRELAEAEKERFESGEHPSDYNYVVSQHKVRDTIGG